MTRVAGYALAGVVHLPAPALLVTGGYLVTSAGSCSGWWCWT